MAIDTIKGLNQSQITSISGVPLSNIQSVNDITLSTYSSVNSWLFDGSDDYAEASVNCPTSAGSVSFWFKFGATVGTDVLWNWHYNGGTGGDLNRGFIEAQFLNVSNTPSAKDIRMIYYPGKNDPNDTSGLNGSNASGDIFDPANITTNSPHAITQMLVSSSNHGSAYSRYKYNFEDFVGVPPNYYVDRFVYNANRLIPSNSHSVTPSAGTEHGWHHFVFTWDTSENFTGKNPQYPNLGFGNTSVSGHNRINPTAAHDGTTTNYSGVMKIYMDGTLRNFGQSNSPDYGYQGTHLNINNYPTLTNDYGDTISLNKFRISARGNNNNHLPGNWTDVAVFNTAIDADAVLAMYNSGTPTELTSNSGNYDYSNNLLGYWKLDETSGTTFADTSGNGNNMTLYNNPTFDSGDAPTQN
jgi:hypothetical protein